MVAPVVHCTCPWARSITATTGLPGTCWPDSVIFSPSLTLAHTPTTTSATMPIRTNAIVGPGSRFCERRATSLPAITASLPWCGRLSVAADCVVLVIGGLPLVAGALEIDGHRDLLKWGGLPVGVQHLLVYVHHALGSVCVVVDRLLAGGQVGRSDDTVTGTRPGVPLPGCGIGVRAGRGGLCHRPRETVRDRVQRIPGGLLVGRAPGVGPDHHRDRHLVRGSDRVDLFVGVGSWLVAAREHQRRRYRCHYHREHHRAGHGHCCRSHRVSFPGRSRGGELFGLLRHDLDVFLGLRVRRTPPYCCTAPGPAL